MTEKGTVLFTRYPLRNIFIYNGTTILHYILGATGIITGYNTWYGWTIGIVYLLLALSEMYLHMPLVVCPNCVYYTLEGSRCISGLNLLSRTIAQEGSIKRFGDRAKGALCPNNLYLASLAFPIIAIIPALVINFTVAVLVMLLALVGLLIFRFFVIFPKIACVHCRAQKICPQARQMGFR